MAEEIRVDYQQLEQVVSRFGSQAEAVAQIIQRIKSGMDPLEQGGWIGRGASAFFDEMQSDVLPALHRFQSSLESARQIMQQNMQTMRQAEEEASSRFRNPI